LFAYKYLVLAFFRLKKKDIYSWQDLEANKLKTSLKQAKYHKKETQK
jgi:hypothetical protein